MLCLTLGKYRKLLSSYVRSTSLCYSTLDAVVSHGFYWSVSFPMLSSVTGVLALERTAGVLSLRPFRGYLSLLTFWSTRRILFSTLFGVTSDFSRKISCAAPAIRCLTNSIC